MLRQMTVIGAGIMTPCACIRLYMSHFRPLAFVSKTWDSPWWKECGCFCPAGICTWMDEPVEQQCAQKTMTLICTVRRNIRAHSNRS